MILKKNMNLKLIRSDIKKIGFNFRLKKYSNFSYLEFYHIETNTKLPDIFINETKIMFNDLLDYLRGLK